MTIASYFTSEKWSQAWGNTAGVATLATANGINMGLLVNQYASMMASFGGNDFMTELVKLGGLFAAASAMNVGTSFYESHAARGLATHIREGFAKATQADPELSRHISKQMDDMKDEINGDEKVTLEHSEWDAPENYANALVVRSAVTLNTVVAIGAVMTALYQNALPIEVIDNLATQISDLFPNSKVNLSVGDKATFYATIPMVLGYGYVAQKFGKHFGELAEAKHEIHENAKSRIKRKLVNVFETKYMRADDLPEHVQVADGKWKEFINARIKHLAFMEGSRYGNMWLSFLPPALFLQGLPTAGVRSSMENFFATQGASMALMDKISDIVNLLSSRGDLRVPKNQITNAADDITKAWHKKMMGQLGKDEVADTNDFRDEPELYVLTADDAKALQEEWGLSDEDMEIIEQRLLAHSRNPKEPDYDYDIYGMNTDFS